MIPYGFRERQQQDDHHLMIACVAVLLSAIIHLILMFFFADWNITGFARLGEKGREWLASERVPPMRVETMRADPMRIAEKVPGERDTPSRGPIEVSEKVETLSQSAGPALTAPPPVPREALAPGVPTLKEVAVAPVDTTPWMPRQEITQIFDRTVQDSVATLPRREIPVIERVPQAPDVVPSIDMVGRRFGRDPEAPKPMKAADVFDTEIAKGTIKTPAPGAPGTPSQVSSAATGERFAAQPGEKNGVAGATGAGGTKLAKAQDEVLKKQAEDAVKKVPESAVSDEERKAREAQAQIAALQDTIDYIPIDDMLAVGLEIYRDPEEPGRIYFRIGIQPRADKKIPVIAKDIVWVQDVSASISEERLTFCRRGLSAALETMNPEDRFVVIAFRESFASCFSGWTAVTPESKKKADEFVSAMRSFGQTDVFGSLQSLIKLPRDPKRPMIAVVVTDGKPTFGMTESAKIIGAFSRLNGGLVSVYMFGTQSRANTYLLDMLTYCNRGASTVLSGNRWDIPVSMATVYQGVRNPVMADITVVFDSVSKSEVYPKSTTNLYKDRPLELAGVCPEGTGELVFQLRGLAADKGYDSIFRLSLTRHAKLGTPGIKALWAQQKMFHLVGAYSRDPQQQTFAEMLKVNKAYGVKIPYEDELK
jgi:energy-coupling factor transporter ATP-binding protein EcfA2